jgi:hypothetical protein
MQAPSKKRVEAALPVRPLTGRRDLRLMFHDGWILMLGLVCFGAAAIGLFLWSAPRGGQGWLRFAAAVGLVTLAGGVAGPLVTRALRRR